jgi:hypothetical protein
MLLHARRPTLFPQLMTQHLTLFHAEVQMRPTAGGNRRWGGRRRETMVIEHALPVGVAQLLTQLLALIGRQALRLADRNGCRTEAQHGCERQQTQKSGEDAFHDARF